MIQERLNDAAIALNRVFARNGINFGAIGGVRESKDIDCLASVSKEQVIGLLDGQEGFQAIAQSRQDYVAFLWSDHPSRRQAVLVEIFCERFPGSQYSMRGVFINAIAIQGGVLGQGVSSFFDPFYLFKGKLRAAATRSKFHDSADLRLLANRYESIIRPRIGQLSLEYIGLAIKRYVELERLFEKLGVDLGQARAAAESLELNRLPPPAAGDVQRGLLG